MGKKKTDHETTKPRYLSFWSILFVLSVVGIIIMLRKFVCFHGDMLFWFFASTSQSMAALFAVGGVFAVFRFQAQEAKLRNLIDGFKYWAQVALRHKYFREFPEQWKDDEVVIIGREARQQLQEEIDRLRKDNGSDEETIKEKEVDVKVIKTRIDEIDDNEKKRNGVLESVKRPMLVILITFMISIGSLPFTSYISESLLGLIILILTMALITYSMCCVFTFISFSLSLKKKPS